MVSQECDGRVDDYIGEAAPFAKPVLIYLRELLHRVVPDCEESIKWRMPFFIVAGRNIAHMAAFKHHCAFGIWSPAVAAEIKAQGGESETVMGNFGRITSIKDLPPEKTMARYVKMAAEGARAGKPTMPKRKPKPKGPIETPPAFARALARTPGAKKAFELLRPSHQREYTEWIAAAKREETRDRRIAKTLDLLAEGKSFNWKYEKVQG